MIAGVFLRGKILVADAITAPIVGRVIRRALRERVPGVGFVADTTTFDDRVVASVFFGLYEKAERRFVNAYLPSDTDVIELGGSLGIVTQTIARRLASGRRIVTVEADTRLAAKLADRVKRCPVEVTVVHGAVDYATSGARTSFASSNDNLAGHLGGGATVPRVTLGELVQRHGLERYALVCDIEGAEAGIVTGDAEALSGCTHIIIETHAVEWRGKRFSPDDYRHSFEALGFRTLASHGPVFAFARA